jgi:hypothetical protein
VAWGYVHFILLTLTSSEIFKQFEFLRQISSNPENTVVGLVRDKAATDKKIASELDNRQNIHIVQGDMTDYASLKVLGIIGTSYLCRIGWQYDQKAVEDTAEITGGALDYVIANAAWQSTWSAYDPIGVLYVDLLL